MGLDRTIGERRLRVALYSPTVIGGHAVHVRCLAEALNELGADIAHVSSVDFALPQASGVATISLLPALRPKESFRSTRSWAMNRLIHYTRRDIRFAKWILRERSRLDVVHLQEWSPWMLPILVRSAHLAGVTVAATVHNVAPHRTDTRIRRLLSSFERRAFRHLDVIFVHEGLESEVARVPSLAQAKNIVFVPLGVFPSESVDVPREQRTALLLGQVRRNKGTITFLEAAAKLPEWHFLVRGLCTEESLDAEIRATAPPNVSYESKFLTDDDINALVASATVMALPYTSDFKAQSGVLYLAMGAKVPVIVSPIPSLEAVVTANHCGIVMDDFGGEALVRAIRQFEALEFASQFYPEGAEENLSGWSEAARRSLLAYTNYQHR